MKKPTSTLSSLGEFGLIARIAAHAAAAEGVVTGIGDDAAVTRLSPGMHLLTSTDMLLEDVHFRRSWHDPYRLGRKSLAVNISDIAAMGGKPRWATLSLAIPADLPLDFLDAFVDGFLAIAAEHGVTLVGGDTCSSRGGLVISVTIMGEQSPDMVVHRSGAREGDDIWVTGTLGDAALGLALLEGSDGNLPEAASFLLSRLLDPIPRSAAGLALAEAGLATAMIDISDGLLADYGHIAEHSAVGGIIHLDALPVSDAFRSVSASYPTFPYYLLLSGGEDYELAFTAPPAQRKKIELLLKTCGIAAAPVGIVSRSPEVVVLHADGTRYQPPNAGFNHFNP